MPLHVGFTPKATKLLRGGETTQRAITEPEQSPQKVHYSITPSAEMRRERASPSIDSRVVSYRLGGLGQGSTGGDSMNTVKDGLAQKSGALIRVRSGDMVV